MRFGSPTEAIRKLAGNETIARDLATGGSTDTVRHLLAAVDEAGHDHTLDDVDVCSLQVPSLTEVAMSGPYLIKGVHLADGIPTDCRHSP